MTISVFWGAAAGLGLRGDGPQRGAGPAPDHPAAGAIAPVPAPTPPDRPASLLRCFFFLNPVSASLQFMQFFIPAGLKRRLNHLDCSQHEHTSACRVRLIFLNFCFSLLWLVNAETAAGVIFTPSFN